MDSADGISFANGLPRIGDPTMLNEYGCAPPRGALTKDTALEIARQWVITEFGNTPRYAYDPGTHTTNSAISLAIWPRVAPPKPCATAKV
jgi:hypothetical protein